MAENAHSKWSASKFKQLMFCPGSMVLGKGQPRRTSKFAAEGGATHNLLEMCLRTKRDAVEFKGQILQADGFEFEVDDDMIGHIQLVIDQVRDLQGPDGVLMVEQRVCYADYLGVPASEAWGTADVIIARGDEVIVADLKYGRGEEVEVERNPQLMLYGLGTLAAHQGLSGDFVRVRLVILQPRVAKRPSEWTIPVDELEAWGRGEARSAVCTVQNAEGTHVAASGDSEWEDTFLRPGESQCRWCKAKAVCPKLRSEVAGVVFGESPASPDDFADLTATTAEDLKASDDAWLNAAMLKATVVEQWLGAVRSEVESRLLAGVKFADWKLVKGRMGNRAWADATVAETTLKGMRLKQEEMYDLKLISPTQAEKVLADSPRRWKRVKELIVRADGKPHVAPMSDKSPPLDVTPTADEFEDLDAGQDLV